MIGWGWAAGVVAGALWVCPAVSQDGAQLEEGMKRVVSRIPELETAFRQAQAEGVELFLYGGTTRSLAFYVKDQLREKGAAFLRETGTIPLEDVVGPYSDLDMIIRGSADAASRLQATLASEFPEGERFYRWEARTEEFLKESWQITQGYEPISKILFGKAGLTELDWRRDAFGESLTERGIGEVLSGRITYVRNPRYGESQPYRNREHHEILEAFRYLRFLHEFKGVEADPASLDSVKAILGEARASKELRRFLEVGLFKTRFEVGLAKLQYTSRDNVRLMKTLDELGVTALVRKVGMEEQLRTPLPDAPAGASGKLLGERLVVYHGTKGYKPAWSIARGGPFITTYTKPQGLFTALDPRTSQQYMDGSDALLKITLSPNARVGVDVTAPSRDGVVIVLSRQAIESVEKPLTAVELGGRLQAALAQGVSEDIDRYLEELERRMRRGDGSEIAAFRAVQRAAAAGRLPDRYERRFVDLLKAAIGKVPLSYPPVDAVSDYLVGGARREHVVEITDEMLADLRRDEIAKRLVSRERFPGSLRDHPEVLSELLDRLSTLKKPKDTYYVALAKILSDPAVEKMPAGFLQTTLDQSGRALERALAEGEARALLEAGVFYEGLAEAVSGRPTQILLREYAAKAREAAGVAYWGASQDDRLWTVERIVSGRDGAPAITEFLKKVIESDPHPQVRWQAWVKLGAFPETWKALVADALPREKNPYVQYYVIKQALYQYHQSGNPQELNALSVLLRTARNRYVLDPLVRIAEGRGNGVYVAEGYYSMPPPEARAELKGVLDARLRDEGLTLEDFKVRYGLPKRVVLYDKVLRLGSKADPSEMPGWVSPQDRLRRSAGRVIRDEVKGAGTFAAAYLAKEAFSAAVSGDARKIGAAIGEMKQPMFWGSLGVFSGASQLAHRGLGLLPGRLSVFTRAWLPLAAGMAAMQGLSGRFSGSELAWSTGTFLVVGTAVDVVTRALVGPGGWWVAVTKLAATLYGAEKLEGIRSKLGGVMQ